MSEKKPSLSELLGSHAKAQSLAEGNNAKRQAAPPVKVDRSVALAKLFAVKPVSSVVPERPPVEALTPPPKAEPAPVKKKSRKRRAYELKDKCPKTLTGAQVRAWRAGIGITQDKARKLLGMQRTSYIELERDGTRSKRTVLALRAILRGLHKSPVYKHERETVAQKTLDTGPEDGTVSAPSTPPDTE